MPTLIDLDSFAHQKIDTSQAGSGFNGVYDQSGISSGISFDTVNKRTSSHVASLKITHDGANATSVGRTISAVTTIVESIYIRASGHPAGGIAILRLIGPTAAPLIKITTSGFVTVEFAGGTVQTYSVDITDGGWHRIDLKILTSTTVTNTIDWYVDGVSQTQATIAAQAAATMTSWRIGSTTLASNGYSVWYQDFTLSATAGDFPLGDHHCGARYPVGEGTDNLLAHIADAGAGTTNLWQSVDDWNGGTPDTSTFISQNTSDTAAFAEFTLASLPNESAIWDVNLLVAGFASTTGTDTANLKLLASHGGATIDSSGLIDWSGSTTVLGYFRKMLARISGGWTPSNLATSVIQWGFSNDVIGKPQLSAVMLEYAAPETNATPTPSTVAGVSAVPAPTVLSGAIPTPAAVAGIGAVPAPTVIVPTDATVTPSVVAGVAAVPAPTTLAGAIPTPSTVAGVATVPSPTVTGGAIATPAVVAGVAAVPAPAPSGGALVTPEVVAGIAAVPAPTVTGGAKPTPSAVAGVAAVPAPTVTAAALVTPATVVGIAAVPAPSPSAGALTTPSTVAGVATVPAPTVVGGALATPAAVAGVGAVPAPSVKGDANTTPASVSGVAAIPAPTVSGGVITTPTTVAGIGAVPTPIVDTGGGDVIVTPDVVVGVAAIPAPSVSAGALTTPATVIGVASVPAPTVDVTASATATPSTVIGIAAVPAPSVHGDTNVSPASVDGIASIPTPTIIHETRVTPNVVAGFAAIPAPTVSGDANAHPATVAAIAYILAPTIFIISAHKRGFISTVDFSQSINLKDSGKFAIDTDNSSREDVTIEEASQG